MITERLSDSDRQILLRIARESIERAVNIKQPLAINLADYSPILQQDGASFVTLNTHNGDLRGCIGALEPYQPLVQDVCEHAVAAALEDFRFPPMQVYELPIICIEISRLTLPVLLNYDSPEDLPKRLRPGIDGLIIKDGYKRATFLPQVWEKLTSPEEFLGHLCLKMGVAPDTWRRKMLQALTYQVEEFSEV